MVSGAVFALIEQEAHRRAEDAAYRGSYGDGGAGLLRDQVRFYKMGRDGQFPQAWEKYRIQAEREADPEWSEFVRLKEKFGES